MSVISSSALPIPPLPAAVPSPPKHDRKHKLSDPGIAVIEDADEQPAAKRHKKDTASPKKSATIKEAALAALPAAAASSAAASSSSTEKENDATQQSFFKHAKNFFDYVSQKQENTTVAEMTQLFNEIFAERKSWHEQAMAQKSNFFVSSSEKLPRSVFCTEDNKIYILFNKAKDFLIAEGGTKKVKLALCFETGEWDANASIPNDKAHGTVEVENFKELKGIPGICQLNQHVKYVSKKKKRKVRILTTRQPQTLHELTVDIHTKKIEISDETTKHILNQLFNIVIELHKRKILYRDFKPTNILLSADNHLTLTDFGSLCREADVKSREGADTTIWFASPEYAAAYLQVKETSAAAGADNQSAPNSYISSPDLVSANTKALDIWSVGIMVYFFLYGNPPWFGLNLDVEALDDLLQFASESGESLISKPANENSYQYLLWRMLMIEPSQRLTTEELEASLKKPLELINENKSHYKEIEILQDQRIELMDQLRFMNETDKVLHSKSIEKVKLAISSIHQRLSIIRRNPGEALVNATNQITAEQEKAILEKALTKDLYTKILDVQKIVDEAKEKSNQPTK